MAKAAKASQGSGHRAADRARGRRGRPRGGSEKLIGTIFEATLRHLGDRGFSALSVEEVAHEVGINKTSIYRRWPSKHELVLAALMSLRDEQPPPAESGNLREDLIVLLRSRAALITTPRARKIIRALITLDDGQGAALAQALREERYRVPNAILRHAIARGELAADSDPTLLSELLLAPLCYRAIIMNQPIEPGYIERIVDQVLSRAAG